MKNLFLLIGALAASNGFAGTWQCVDSSGHAYKASQNVPSDKCTFASEKSIYPKEKSAARFGVMIGMTPDEVIHETAWGKPKKVNRTTNKFGTHEQWVYGGGNYLYFENGVLTSYQN